MKTKENRTHPNIAQLECFSSYRVRTKAGFACSKIKVRKAGDSDPLASKRARSSQAHFDFPTPSTVCQAGYCTTLCPLPLRSSVTRLYYCFEVKTVKSVLSGQSHQHDKDIGDRIGKASILRHVVRGEKCGYSGPFAWDTSPKSIDREGLGKSRTGTRQ